ncbi:MAG TPA: IS200/IS605 family transposase [Chthonomonadaceae bacterium]|nr:IS200/IS605 family transposase [Chthonomonadaceae bacterium]
MREPYTQLYLHLVWSTWERLPLLTGEIRDAVYACLQSECVALKADVLAMGGIEDHVHIRLRIPATVSIAMLVKQIKGASSHMITHKVGHDGLFRWQEGYGAFTITKSDVPRVRHYILNQEAHHHANTPQAEWEITAR